MDITDDHESPRAIARGLDMSKETLRRKIVGEDGGGCEYHVAEVIQASRSDVVERRVR